MFVFGFETSLRYSDIVTVRKHHIINGYIIKRSVKTNVQHIIPLNNRITSILEKYNYNLNLYKNQPYDRLLKDMAKDSGIFDKDVIIIEQYGNKTLEIKKKKWECIESHTARRTFITLKIMENVPINIIMANAGLKRLDTILHYMDKYGPVKKY